jgi:hypothetical protein
VTGLARVHFSTVAVPTQKLYTVKEYHRRFFLAPLAVTATRDYAGDLTGIDYSARLLAMCGPGHGWAFVLNL